MVAENETKPESSETPEEPEINLEFLDYSQIDPLIIKLILDLRKKGIDVFSERTFKIAQEILAKAQESLDQTEGDSNQTTEGYLSKIFKEAQEDKEQILEDQIVKILANKIKELDSTYNYKDWQKLDYDQLKGNTKNKIKSVFNVDVKAELSKEEKEKIKDIIKDQTKKRNPKRLGEIKNYFTAVVEEEYSNIDERKGFLEKLRDELNKAINKKEEQERSTFFKNHPILKYLESQTWAKNENNKPWKENNLQAILSALDSAIEEQELNKAKLMENKEKKEIATILANSELIPVLEKEFSTAKEILEVLGVFLETEKEFLVIEDLEDQKKLKEYFNHWLDENRDFESRENGSDFSKFGAKEWFHKYAELFGELAFLKEYYNDNQYDKNKLASIVSRFRKLAKSDFYIQLKEEFAGLVNLDAFFLDAINRNKTLPESLLQSLDSAIFKILELANNFFYRDYDLVMEDLDYFTEQTDIGDSKKVDYQKCKKLFLEKKTKAKKKSLELVLNLLNKDFNQDTQNVYLENLREKFGKENESEEESETGKTEIKKRFKEEDSEKIKNILEELRKDLKEQLEQLKQEHFESLETKDKFANKIVQAVESLKKENFKATAEEIQTLVAELLAKGAAEGEKEQNLRYKRYSLKELQKEKFKELNIPDEILKDLKLELEKFNRNLTVLNNNLDSQEFRNEKLPKEVSLADLEYLNDKIAPVIAKNVDKLANQSVNNIYNKMSRYHQLGQEWLKKIGLNQDVANLNDENFGKIMAKAAVSGIISTPMYWATLVSELKNYSSRKKKNKEVLLKLIEKAEAEEEEEEEEEERFLLKLIKKSSKRKKGQERKNALRELIKRISEIRKSRKKKVGKISKARRAWTNIKTSYAGGRQEAITRVKAALISGADKVEILGMEIPLDSLKLENQQETGEVEEEKTAPGIKEIFKNNLEQVFLESLKGAGMQFGEVQEAGLEHNLVTTSTILDEKIVNDPADQEKIRELNKYHKAGLKACGPLAK